MKKIKRNYKQMNLFEDLRMLILKFNFAMIFLIYIIHNKILALHTNHLNYLKDNIFEYFLRSIMITYNI